MIYIPSSISILSTTNVVNRNVIVNTVKNQMCFLQVSAATAQLLLACKVKADPNSSALRRYLCLYI